MATERLVNIKFFAKVIGALVLGLGTVIALMVGLQALAYNTVGSMPSDGFGLSDDTVAQSIRDYVSQGTPLENANTVQMEAGEDLYKNFFGYAVGSDRRLFNADYPVYLNSGTALLDVTGDKTLIERDFSSTSSFVGMTLSSGKVYSETGALLDEGPFLFLKLKNGLYVNTEEVQLNLATRSSSITIPVNSLISFSEGRLEYYSHKNGQFVGSTVEMSEASTSIKLAQLDEMTYIQFLYNMGITKPASTPAAKPASEDSNVTNVVKVASTTPSTTTESSTPSTTTESSTPAEWRWIRPTATAGQLSASVYRATGELSINDPAGVITKPIRYEFWEGDTMYMRASLRSSGAFRVDGLKPDSTYEVRAYLTYALEDESVVEEEILSQTITTGSVGALGAVSFTFHQGEIKSNAVVLDGFQYTEGSEELLANISSLTYSTGSKSFAVPKSNLREIINKQASTITSSTSLTSNSSYSISLSASDRFGHAIAVNAPVVDMITAKAVPTAPLALTSNNINSSQLTVQINDKDSSLVGDPIVSVYDSAGNLIISQSLTNLESTVTIPGLLDGEYYSAVVVADYAIDDGKGVYTQQEIGSTTFTVTSVNTLGYTLINVDMVELGDTYANVEVSLNMAQMNTRLLELLDGISFSVSANDTIAYSKKFNTAEIASLVSGGTISVPIAGLASKTDYTITGSSTITLGQGTHSKVYDINTTVKNDTFKTLKLAPEVRVTDSLVTSDRIGFSVAVVDTDEVIAGGCMVEIRDENGRLAAEQQTFSTGVQPTAFLFQSLSDNSVYTINIIAYDYNMGYTTNTFESRKVLKTMTISTREGVTADLELRGLDEISGDSKHLSAHVRVKTQDLWSELNPKQFSINVYKDDTLVDTFALPYTQTIETQDFYYTVDKGLYTYKFEISAYFHMQTIVFDSLELSSEKKITGIDHAFISDDGKYGYEAASLESMKNDLYGYYILLNDITVPYSTSGWHRLYRIAGGSWDHTKEFQGTLDGQGYTIDRQQEAYSLFFYLGKEGQIKNLNFIAYYGKSGEAGSLLYTNYGTITNVAVTMKLTDEMREAYQSSDYYRQSYSPLCYTNERYGTIDGFTINLTEDLRTNAYAGGACYYSNGTIKNGYVYGDGRIVVPDDIPTDLVCSYVAGVVGNCGGDAYTQNVFTTIDLVVPTDRKISNYGLVAGYCPARLNGVFSTGTIYNDPSTGNVGPVVSNPSGSSGFSTNIHYYRTATMTVDYNNTYNKRASVDSFYDQAWYSSAGFNSADRFNLAPVVSEYLPKVSFPTCMPAQPNLDLPGRESGRSDPELTSITVLNEGDEESTVALNFYNPGGNTITAVNVTNLKAEVLKQTEGENFLSTVQVKLSDPKAYTTGYDVSSFTFTTSTGRSSSKSYGAGKFTIPISFYKMIYTIEDWAQIKEALSNNYRLGADLDFAQYTSQNDMSMTGGSYFYGTLDGNGHTISNCTFTDNNLLVRNLSGTIKNLTIENFNVSSTWYGSFIVGNAIAGSVMENIIVKNSTLTGTTAYTGGLFGAANTTTIKDCAVVNCAINIERRDSVNDVAAGGLVGYMYRTSISNCFTQDVSIEVGNLNRCLGTGGLVGYMNTNSTISNCYAHGSINSKTSRCGGLVGYSTNGCVINSVFSKVKVQSTADKVGGIVGYASYDLGSLNGLALGDIITTTYGTSNVNPVLGQGTALGYAYVYSRQKVNGISPENSSSSRPYTYTYPSLTYSQLSSWDTYTGTIGLDQFSSEGVSSGNLPKVLSSTGEILFSDTQRTISLNEETVNVTKIEAGITNNAEYVRAWVQHPDNYEVTGLVFDYLTDGEITENTTTSGVTSITYEGLDYSAAYDSYLLTGIELKDKTTGATSTYSVCERIDFGQPMYNNIISVSGDAGGTHDVSWQNIATTHTREGVAGGYENYQITADLDFTGYKNVLTGLSMGRLAGAYKQGGYDGNDYPTIKNLSYVVSGTNRALVNLARNGVNGLMFDNISVSNSESSEVWGESILGSVYGSGEGGLHDVTFSNVNIVTGSNSKVAKGVGIVALVDGTATNITMTDITVETKQNASGDRFMAGLVARTMQGSTLSNVTAKNIKVKGTGNYVGGIVGHMSGNISNCTLSTSAGGTAYDGNVIQSFNTTNGYSCIGGIVGGADSGYYWLNLKVSNTTVYAPKYSNVGGIVGSCGSTYVRNSSVEYVKCQGNYHIGGAVGNGYTTDYGGWKLTGRHLNNYADRVIVQGGTYVGGWAGNGYTNFVTVENATVSGSNHVGGACGNGWGHGVYVVGTISGSGSTATSTTTVKSTGDYCGGLCGSSGYWYWAGVKGVTVNCGGNYVSGLNGQCSSQIQGCYVQSTVVNATKKSNGVYVGGLCGYSSYRGTSNLNIVQGVSLNASNYSYVGGLFGYLSNEYSSATANNTIQNSLFNGTVTGKDYVGALVGLSNAGVTTSWNSLSVGAETVVKCTGAHGSLGVGAANFVYHYGRYVRIMADATATVNGTTITANSSMTVSDLFGSECTADDLAVPTTKTTKGNNYNPKKASYWTYANSSYPGAGANFSNSYFTKKDNYYPVIKSWSWSYARSGVLPFQDYVSVKNSTDTKLSLSSSTASLMSASDNETDNDVSVYASSASTVNVDVPTSMLNATYTLSDGNDTVATGTISSRATSFSYDFKTPASLTITDKDGYSTTVTLDPNQLHRGASVYDKTAYWITDSGIRGSDGSTLSGNFVNLSGEYALDSNGVIWNVTTGTSTSSRADNAPSTDSDSACPAAFALKDAVPVTTGTYGGSQYDTYGTFTMVGGQTGTVREMLLYAKDGVLNMVSADMAQAGSDAVILGKKDNKKYQTVLTSDGKLADLGESLVYPENFNNNSIRFATSAAQNGSTVAVVEYQSGRVLAFDFTTGEVLADEGGSADLSLSSLTTFASDFFEDWLDLSTFSVSVPSTAAYRESQDLQDYLSSVTLTQSDKMSADEAQGVIDATKSAVESSDNSSSSSATSESADDGTVDSSVELSAESTGASVESSSESSGQSGSVQTGGGFGKAQSYASMWNPETGTYETYAESDIMGSSQSNVVSQNKARDLYPTASPKVSVSEEAIHWAQYAAAIALLVVALVVLYNRRRKAVESQR